MSLITLSAKKMMEKEMMKNKKMKKGKGLTSGDGPSSSLNGPKISNKILAKRMAFPIKAQMALCYNMGTPIPSGKMEELMRISYGKGWSAKSLGYASKREYLMSIPGAECVMQSRIVEKDGVKKSINIEYIQLTQEKATEMVGLLSWQLVRTFEFKQRQFEMSAPDNEEMTPYQESRDVYEEGIRVTLEVIRKRNMTDYEWKFWTRYRFKIPMHLLRASNIEEVMQKIDLYITDEDKVVKTNKWDEIMKALGSKLPAQVQGFYLLSPENQCNINDIDVTKASEVHDWRDSPNFKFSRRFTKNATPVIVYITPIVSRGQIRFVINAGLGSSFHRGVIRSSIRQCPPFKRGGRYYKSTILLGWSFALVMMEGDVIHCRNWVRSIFYNADNTSLIAHCVPESVCFAELIVANQLLSWTYDTIEKVCNNPTVRSQMRNRMLRHYRDEAEGKDTPRPVCPYCFMAFKTGGEVANHSAKYHFIQKLSEKLKIALPHQSDRGISPTHPMTVCPLCPDKCDRSCPEDCDSTHPRQYENHPQLISHLKCHIRKGERGDLSNSRVCLVCGKIETNESDYQRHIRIHLRVLTKARALSYEEALSIAPTATQNASLDEEIATSQEQLKSRYPCLHCDKEFVGPRLAVKHMESTHPTFDPEKINIYTYIKILQDGKGGKKNELDTPSPLKCGICQRGFQFTDDYYNHLDKAHEGELVEFQCVSCEKRSKLVSTLGFHWCRYHSNKPCCRLCNTFFISKSHLEIHCKLSHQINEEDFRRFTSNKQPMSLPVMKSPLEIPLPVGKSTPEIPKNPNRDPVTRLVPIVGTDMTEQDLLLVRDDKIVQFYGHVQERNKQLVVVSQGKVVPVLHGQVMARPIPKAPVKNSIETINKGSSSTSSSSSILQSSPSVRCPKPELGKEKRNQNMVVTSGRSTVGILQGKVTTMPIVQVPNKISSETNKKDSKSLHSSSSSFSSTSSSSSSTFSSSTTLQTATRKRKQPMVTRNFDKKPKTSN